MVMRTKVLTRRSSGATVEGTSSATRHAPSYSVTGCLVRDPANRHGDSVTVGNLAGLSRCFGPHHEGHRQITGPQPHACPHKPARG